MFGVASAAHGNTYASLVTFDCASSGACSRSVVAVNPQGKSLSTSTSGLPQDAWVSSSLRGPYVSRDEELFWSHTQTPFDTGRLDLASGEYSVKANAFIYNYYPQSNVALFALRPSSSGLATEIAAPTGTELQPLASLPDGMQDTNGAWPFPVSLGSLVIYQSRTSVGSSYTYSLHAYTVGSSTVSDVMIDGASATSLDELLRLPPYGNELVYCLRRGSTMWIAWIDAISTRSAVVPFESCNYVHTYSYGTASVIWGYNPAASTVGAVFVRSGSVFPIFSEPGNASGPQAFGTSLPAFTFTTPPSSNRRVWILTPSNTVVQLGIGLVNAVAETYGDTVIVAGIQPGTNGFGQLTVDRYRVGAGIDRVAVASNVVASAEPQVIVSAQGGGIINYYTSVWALPAAASSATALDLFGPVGGRARGSQTLIVARKPGPTEPALYAYDEVNSAPRLTQLSSQQSNLYAAYLDPSGGGESVWFSYSSTATTCGLARIVTGLNGVPALDSLPCSGFLWSSSYYGPDLDDNNVVVVADAGMERVYVLAASGAREVARGHSIRPIESYENRLLGWVGTDALGGFACMSKHPDWCWRLPAATTTRDRFVSVAFSGSDGSFVAQRLTQTGSTLSIDILRTINAGERLQPLL